MMRAAPLPVAVLLSALVTLSLVACRDRTGSNGPVATTAANSTTSATGTSISPTETTVVSSASSGCGTSLLADLAAGKTTVRKVTHSGRERSYRLHIPARYNQAKPAPLVLNFHGRGSNGLEQEVYSGLLPLSDREGFVLVSPDGLGESWMLTPGVDDVAFARDLVTTVSRELCVDATRVYSTGMSNGAFLSSRLGCVASDLVAAVAPVAGVGPAESCGKPVPMLAFQGTDDQAVRFNGGPLPVAGNYPGVMPMMAAWAKLNGCGSEAKEEPVSAHVKRLVYPGCKADTSLYIIEGGGHTWPGAMDVPRLGPVTKEISAAELIWAFFREHARK